MNSAIPILRKSSQGLEKPVKVAKKSVEISEGLMSLRREVTSRRVAGGKGGIRQGQVGSCSGQKVDPQRAIYIVDTNTKYPRVSGHFGWIWLLVACFFLLPQPGPLMGTSEGSFEER